MTREELTNFIKNKKSAQKREEKKIVELTIENELDYAEIKNELIQKYKVKEY